MKKFTAMFLVLLTVFTLTACLTDEEDADVTIASKPMTEQYILAEMMKTLIETDTTLSVKHVEGVSGGTANIHPSMIEGEIDIYAEYTGTAWLTVLDEEPIEDPDELFAAVKAAYADEFNIHWMDRYGFNNGFGIAMRRDDAEAMGIETYSDLFEQQAGLTFAANPDFFERSDGYDGLLERYDADPFDDVVEMNIGLAYTALANQEADVIISWTTDGQLQHYDLKILEDDLQFFITYHAATLIRQEILDEFPEIEPALAKLVDAIDDAAMIEMNYRVEIGQEDPGDVARDFMREQGWID